ncbi:MAG: GNAT family N-acetyltransferase [Alphaproteobacteria bacterium]
MSKPIFETPRLILREWEDTDVTPFAALFADPFVIEHIPPPDRLNVEAITTSIREHLARPDGLGWWAIEERNGAPFIGFTGLSIVRLDVPFVPAVDVGWCLARDQWGKGYASEAAKAMTEYGLGMLGLPEIVAFTIPANMRARAVMERIGMTRDPEDDFDNPRLEDGDPFKRHVLYRLGNKA